MLNFRIVNLLNCHEEPNILFIMLIMKFFTIESEQEEKRQEKLKTHFSYDFEKCNVIQDLEGFWMHKKRDTCWLFDDDALVKKSIDMYRLEKRNKKNVCKQTNAMWLLIIYQKNSFLLSLALFTWFFFRIFEYKWKWKMKEKK